MNAGTPVRQIKKVWKSIPTIEGAGVRLKRVFGFREVPQFGLFLLLDCLQSVSCWSPASRSRSRSPGTAPSS